MNRPQNQAAYNTSKAGVIHLTKSLATEWAKYNIRVNSISPGYMEGPLAAPLMKDPNYGPVWMDCIPMHRPGKPEELCPVAVLLASEASSYMTGTNVVIDGGYTAWLLGQITCIIFHHKDTKDTKVFLNGFSLCSLCLCGAKEKISQ